MNLGNPMNRANSVKINPIVDTTKIAKKAKMKKLVTYNPESGLSKGIKVIPLLVGLNPHGFEAQGYINITQEFGPNRRYVSIQLMQDTISMHDTLTISFLDKTIKDFLNHMLPKITNDFENDKMIEMLEEMLAREIIKQSIPKCIPLLEKYLLELKNNIFNPAVKEFCLYLDYMLISPLLASIEVYDERQPRVPNKKFTIEKQNHNLSNAARTVTDTVVAFNLPEIYTQSKIPLPGEPPVNLDFDNLLQKMIEYARHNPLPEFIETATHYTFTTRSFLYYVFRIMNKTILFAYDTSCNEPEETQSALKRSKNVKSKLTTVADLKLAEFIINTPGYRKLYGLLREIYNLSQRFPPGEKIPWISTPDKWPVPGNRGGSNKTIKRRRKTKKRRTNKRKTKKR